MLRGGEYQHPPQDVLVDDVVLDVVGVVLHTERQQLQDQGQQLRRLEVICWLGESQVLDVEHLDRIRRHVCCEFRLQ